MSLDGSLNGYGASLAMHQLRAEREALGRALGGSGGADSSLIDENKRLRALLAQRDAELAAERSERQRLEAIVNASRSGAPPPPESPSRRPPAPAQHPPRSPRTEAANDAANDEADGLLKEVMEELRLQESELARIRSEEREIEARD